MGARFSVSRAFGAFGPFHPSGASGVRAVRSARSAVRSIRSIRSIRSGRSGRSPLTAPPRRRSATANRPPVATTQTTRVGFVQRRGRQRPGATG